jgi:hypothetical protein
MLARALHDLSKPRPEEVPEHFLRFNQVVLPNSRLYQMLVI